ncbi:MAG: hypothetical protein K0R68_1511 [Mycobacterium sp.]|jgi:hypothetical protein|nr:hypothetical protein [Mycobacterium sp.]
MSTVRRPRFTLLAVALLLAGCTATVTGDVTREAQPPGSEGAVVALLDTGDYPTRPGPPVGTAGDDRYLQGLLEAHRIAEHTVPPWQVEPFLRDRGGHLELGGNSPLAAAADLGATGLLPDRLVGIAAAQGFVAGFTAHRAAVPPVTLRSLTNAVLRFPDGIAARSAADAMSTALAPAEPVRLPDHPDAVATGHLVDGDAVVDAMTAYGPYVLYQSAVVVGDHRPDAVRAINTTLTIAKPQIDRLVPTPLDRLAELPTDPTGQLSARTLSAPALSAQPLPHNGVEPTLDGIWQPAAWLNFEDDPVTAEELFDTAGVTVVSAATGTVYQTGEVAGAIAVVDGISAAMDGRRDLEPTAGGVAGLPSARCFERTTGVLPAPRTAIARRVDWRFSCVGRAEEYAFTVFSDTETDAHQQAAAQYRILAGR